MKVTRGSWWILAVVAACSGCAPEKLELGDAPLEEGGAGSGGTRSAGGSTPSGGSSTPGGTPMGDGGADCVSPTQHPERAYDDGVTFCACDDDEDQCVDARALGAGYVALICEDGAWVAVNDGPCGVEKTCFSPTQNLDHAYDEGAIGCACEDEADQCVDSRPLGGPGYVALICDDGAWSAVEDGPCGLAAGKCYSPTRNPERAYDEGAVGCACDGDAAQCVEVDERRFALVCNDGAWTGVEDGPCQPAVCPDGSFEARSCIQCGPAGGCAIFEVGCFTDPSCEDGTCSSMCE